jgi:hypothetical protein
MCACGKNRSNDKCILGLSLEFVREKALVIFPTHAIIPGVSSVSSSPQYTTTLTCLIYGTELHRYLKTGSNVFLNNPQQIIIPGK